MVDIFSGDQGGNLQSLGGEDHVSIEGFGIGRGNSSIPGPGPQLSGCQHYIRVNPQVIKDSFEPIKPTDAFVKACPDQFATNLVIGYFRNVNDQALPEETFKPIGNLAVRAGMRNLAQRAGVKDNCARRKSITEPFALGEAILFNGFF